MKEKRKNGMPIERRWPLLGKWWLICSPSIEGNAISYRSQIRGAWRPRNRGPPRRKNNRITQRADCQVLRLPTERRRSNSRGSLRIVSGLAENTHSIFCDGPHGPETVNGCPVLRRQEPPPRGTYASCGFRQGPQCALLRSARQENLFLLDTRLTWRSATRQLTHCQRSTRQRAREAGLEVEQANPLGRNGDAHHGGNHG